jgi:hypothetical protein
MAHSVSLSWTASTDAVDGYNIYKGPTSGSESTKVNAALVTTTTFVDSTATPGSEFYAVKSSLGGVESVLSNSVDAVILPAPPTALTLVSVS